MYSGDELYSDDVTSGILTDSMLENWREENEYHNDDAYDHELDDWRYDQDWSRDE